MSTSENTRNGTASNVFVYTNTKMSLSRGHFETFRGDPKTLRAELTSGQDHRQRGRETYREELGGTNLQTAYENTRSKGEGDRPPQLLGSSKRDRGTERGGTEESLKNRRKFTPRAKPLTENRSDRPQKRASSIYRGGTERRELSN